MKLLFIVLALLCATACSTYASEQPEPKFKYEQRVTFKLVKFWGEECYGVIGKLPYYMDSTKEYVYSQVEVCCNGQVEDYVQITENNLTAVDTKMKGCK